MALNPRRLEKKEDEGPIEVAPMIIVTGDPVSGFEFIGPFEDEEAAIDYAEVMVEAEWWIAPLDKPIDPL